MHFVIYKHTQLLSDLSTAIAIILIPRLRYGGILGHLGHSWSFLVILGHLILGHLFHLWRNGPIRVPAVSLRRLTLYLVPSQKV